MRHEVLHALQSTLENTGLLHLDCSTAPPSPDLIPYGKFRLVDNAALAARLCDTVADHTGCYWTHTAFKRLQNNTPEKPVEPEPLENPKWKPRSDADIAPHLIEKHGLKEGARHQTVINFTQAQNDHQAALKEYQKLSVQIRAIRAAADFDDRGYMVAFLNALKVDFPAFVESFFFTPRTLYVNEEARKAHTFICAGTKSGKSQTMLGLIRHYLTKNTAPALVILDPHGDLANDTARMRENATNDRLVYIKPGLFKGRYVAFNPFDCTEEERQENALFRRQMQFRGALEQITQKKFTDAQRPFILPILGVLLHKPDTTFKDLVRFMDDDQNSDLVQYGMHQLPNEAHQEFFKHGFVGGYESTKDALKNRFSELIGDPTIRQFLCNPSTVDLAECIRNGKVIVFHFDLEQQSKEAVRTIGQLINAYLVSFAMAQPLGQRHPIHLFADECQYFVSPTIEEIMGETRKFELYATLATQRTNQVGKDLLDAILGNVGCYMIGRNKGKTAEVMGHEQPISADDIKALKPLHFYQIELDRDPVLTKIPVVSGNPKHTLSGEEWLKVLLAQGRTYYRQFERRSDRPTPPPEHNSRIAIYEANKAREPQPLNKGPMFKGYKFTDDS